MGLIVTGHLGPITSTVKHTRYRAKARQRDPSVFWLVFGGIQVVSRLVKRVKGPVHNVQGSIKPQKLGLDDSKECTMENVWKKTRNGKDKLNC